MIWRAMRLRRGFKLSALVALAVPALLALTAIGTLADSSPSPAASPALPGDPTHGLAVYNTNCTVCHGANLEGGIGAVLNPIDKLPGVPNSLDPNFLILIITKGRPPQPGDPKTVAMPAWGAPAGQLSEQDIKDVASYIIQQNLTGGGNGPLSPGELAKRTILWVTIGIIAMVFITYLLAQYNMRWVARRAAARRK
jgi:mono/diheme cytochrome c family protein